MPAALQAKPVPQTINANVRDKLQALADTKIGAKHALPVFVVKTRHAFRGLSTTDPKAVTYPHAVVASIAAIH